MDDHVPDDNRRTSEPSTGQRPIHEFLATTPSTARRKPKKNDTGAAAAKMDTGPPMMTHRRDDPGHTERFADDGQRTWRALLKTSGMEQTAEALTKYTEGNQLMAAQGFQPHSGLYKGFRGNLGKPHTTEHDQNHRISTGQAAVE
jgi:hypothetical protein